MSGDWNCTTYIPAREDQGQEAIPHTFRTLALSTVKNIHGVRRFNRNVEILSVPTLVSSQLSL